MSLPRNLDGMLQLIADFLAINKKRLSHDCENKQLIELHVNRLKMIRLRIESFREGLAECKDRDRQEQFFFDTMLTGILLNEAMYGSTVERGVKQLRSLEKATANNKRDWQALQKSAQDALAKVEKDPNSQHLDKAAKLKKAGELMADLEGRERPYSASAIRNYLAGHHR